MGERKKAPATMNNLLRPYRLSSGALTRSGFAKSVAIMVGSTLAASCIITWPSRLLLPTSLAEPVIAIVLNVWVLVLIAGGRALAKRRLLALRSNLLEADIYLAAAIMAVLIYNLGLISWELALFVHFAEFMRLLRREPGEPLFSWS